MGKIGRITKAIMREMNLRQPKAVEVPAVADKKLLSGHLALVTGGSSGIGLEIARRFAASGCKIVVSGSREKRVSDAVAALDSPNVKGLVIDVTDVAAMDDKISAAAELFPEMPGIDILVNSAGVSAGGEGFGSVEQEAWDKVLDTNLKGAYFMTQAASCHMIARRLRGHVLNVSSSSALRNAKTPYEISKWGMKGMTLGLAEELIVEGIVVNAIAPGPTATAMLGKDPAGSLAHVQNPSGRLAHPGEIANLALVLVSRYGDMIVGDTLYVTGGAGTICIDR